MTATRLIRRGSGGETREWQTEPEVELPEESAPPTARRMLVFEIPDGFMATVSLIPYTEPPAEPETS